MPLKTLQIAMLGGDPDAVAVGIRNFPAHKVALVCLPKDKDSALGLVSNLSTVLKIPVDLHVLRAPGIQPMLETISEVLAKERDNFEDVVINVGGGDKSVTCAGTTAAFIYGVKAFDTMGDTPVMLPILKLSYTEIISKAKFDILRALDKLKGNAEDLEQLVQASGYGKPALSYHLHGAGGESKGLVELGLVEVQREVRGRSRVTLTTLGKMLLLTESPPGKLKH